MPYKLRKAPKRNLYWVVSTETGKKHSAEPISRAKAEAQKRVLESAMLRGGARVEYPLKYLEMSLPDLKQIARDMKLKGFSTLNKGPLILLINNASGEAEAPKAEAPKAEAPKAEAPKAEADADWNKLSKKGILDIITAYWRKQGKVQKGLSTYNKDQLIGYVKRKGISTMGETVEVQTHTNAPIVRKATVVPKDLEDKTLDELKDLVRTWDKSMGKTTGGIDKASKDGLIKFIKKHNITSEAPTHTTLIPQFREELADIAKLLRAIETQRKKDEDSSREDYENATGAMPTEMATLEGWILDRSWGYGNKLDDDLFTKVYNLLMKIVNNGTKAITGRDKRFDVYTEKASPPYELHLNIEHFDELSSILNNIFDIPLDLRFDIEREEDFRKQKKGESDRDYEGERDEHEENADYKIVVDGAFDLSKEGLVQQNARMAKKYEAEQGAEVERFFKEKVEAQQRDEKEKKDKHESRGKDLESRLATAKKLLASLEEEEINYHESSGKEVEALNAKHRANTDRLRKAIKDAKKSIGDLEAELHTHTQATGMGRERRKNKKKVVPDFKSLKIFGGGAIPPRNILQQIANQSYQATASPTIDNMTLIESTPTLVFYNEGDTIVVGIRGTADFDDIKSYVRIPFNTIAKSSRFNGDLSTLLQFQSQYPPTKYDYYGVAHSLGGVILDQFLDMGLLKSGVSYNPAIQSKHLTDTSTKNERIFHEDDPLYKLAKPLLATKPEVRKAENQSFIERYIGNILPARIVYKAARAHQLARFEGGLTNTTDARRCA